MRQLVEPSDTFAGGRRTCGAHDIAIVPQVIVQIYYVIYSGFVT